MRKSWFIMTAAIFVTMIGCENPTSGRGNGGSSGAPSSRVSSVTLQNPSALFVASEMSSTSVNGLSSTATLATQDASANRLYQVTAEERIEEVLFENAAGDTVRIDVTDFYTLSPDLVGIHIEAAEVIESDTGDVYTVSERYTVVVRLTDGAVFDMTKYYLYLPDARVKNGYLYVLGQDQTLYRIDIDTFDSAQPLNNPDFDPVAGTLFIPTGDGHIVHMHSANLTGFFADGSLPPVNIGHVSEALKIEGVRGGGFPLSTIYDENGELYHVNFEWGSGTNDGEVAWAKLELDSNGLQQSDTGKIQGTTTSFTSINQSLNYWSRDYKPWSTGDDTRYILNSDGFAKVTTPTGGGLDVIWEELDLYMCSEDYGSPSFGEYNTKLVGQYVYWQEANSVKQIDLESRARDTLISDPNMTDGFSVVGQTVIYSSYVTATEVHTFFIRPGDSAPTLLDENEVEVVAIEEFEA